MIFAVIIIIYFGDDSEKKISMVIEVTEYHRSIYVHVEWTQEGIRTYIVGVGIYITVLQLIYTYNTNTMHSPAFTF